MPFRYTTALWIATDASDRIESAFTDLPVRVDTATAGFVHFLYRPADWQDHTAKQVCEHIVARLKSRGIPFQPAIGLHVHE